ncbi:MAG TPA: ribonuclease H-like domain-containing protein [Spirochaetota bacterium]|nr:ribonuclease H-like domain-containing protein [Spirochaetota bacterium]
MSLKDKLRRYERSTATAPAAPATGILLEMGGTTLETENGPLWRFATTHPVDNGREAALREFLPSFLMHVGAKPVELERLLFFDLETTGLSGGTGTYPFLTGIGYYRDGAFHVEQYFLDDYASERAILAHLVSVFREANAFVAFNGKTFDIPLIKSRYRLNRVGGFPVDIPVVDLLYPCRRLFKKLYGSCSLKSMEENLLGVRRGDDIPGWEIPDVFFSFQRHGETGRLPLVIEHNRMDVYSMFMLVESLGRVFRSLSEKNYNSIEPRLLPRIAHYLYVTDLVSFLEISGLIHDEVRTDRLLFKKYCTALKRSGRINEALRFWRDDPSIYSLEELAKHCEHRQRDYRLALGHARTARSLIERGFFSEDGEALSADRAFFHGARFARRIARLEARIARGDDAMRNPAGPSRP